MECVCVWGGFAGLKPLQVQRSKLRTCLLRERSIDDPQVIDIWDVVVIRDIHVSVTCTHLAYIHHSGNFLGVHHDVAFSCDLEVQPRAAQFGTAFCSVGETPSRKEAPQFSSPGVVWGDVKPHNPLWIWPQGLRGRWLLATESRPWAPPLPSSAALNILTWYRIKDAPCRRGSKRGTLKTP